MKRAEVFVHVRPFLEHEVESCNILRVPLHSAVLVGTAEGDCDEWFKTGIRKPPGVGVAVVRDVREGKVRLEKEMSNCYWGVAGNLEGSPPFTPLHVVAKDVSAPALNDFLSGRDVAICTFGARASGKTRLLFGDPSDRATPTDTILSTFTESLWEAFGGEEHQSNPNQIKVSVVEITPSGEIFDLISKTECKTDMADTFSGPIPGWNPLWDIISTTNQTLAAFRENGREKGTLVVSLRVEKRGSVGNPCSCPVISFIEMDPLVGAAVGGGLVNEALKEYLVSLEEQSRFPTREYPPGVAYLLQCLQGRAWATKVVGCVSPSPTALQASMQTVSLVSKFYVEVLPSSGMCSLASTPTSLPLDTLNSSLMQSHTTPKREVTGVLAFTPDDNPQPRSGAPRPTGQTPILVNQQKIGSAGSQTPGTEENICSELIGLVKMLKGEVEILRNELADERKRHSEEATKEQALRQERDVLEAKLKDQALKLEIVEGENRTILRELREREDEKEQLVNETHGLHKQIEELASTTTTCYGRSYTQTHVSPSSSGMTTTSFGRRSPVGRRPKLYTTSSPCVYVRQSTSRSTTSTAPPVITPTPGGVGLRTSTPRKTRSRTPPSANPLRSPTAARSSSSGTSTPTYNRRTSLTHSKPTGVGTGPGTATGTGAGAANTVPVTRVPSLISDSTLTSSASSSSPRPAGSKVQRAPGMLTSWF